MKNYEIERKFLIRGELPSLTQAPHHRLRQGYVATGETEVRVRQIDDRYVLTCKRGKGLQRHEVEFAIGKSEFGQLWSMTEGRRIEKTRYEIECGENLLTVDVFEGDLEPLVLAEVEFDSVEASEAFEPPAYCYLDVTQDGRYKNQALALHGVPAEDKGQKTDQ